MGSTHVSQQPVSRPKVTLSDLQAEFRGAVPFGQALLRKLTQEGAENTFIRRPGKPGGPWLLRVKLPPSLQERFALAPEVLLMALGDTEVEARDVDRCSMEIAGAGARLDSEVVIVVDLKAGLFGRLQRLDRRRPWVLWQPSVSKRGVAFPPLFEQIAKQIGENDIFEERDPVRGHQVIGRREDIRKLSNSLLAGKSVGVFGLRKVGKTTLVRAVTDRLDPEGSALSVRRSPGEPWLLDTDDPSQVAAIWVDCQVLYPRTVERLASLLVAQLWARLPDAMTSQKGSEVERLLELLEHWSRGEDLPLTIVLDEYDLLFQGAKGEDAIGGLDVLFGGLRAVSQTTSRLALAVIGRDPSYFRQPTWNGVPNPMLNWFIPQWVGPLDWKGADDLLGTLGRRIGLLVGKRTKAHAYEWTGGHPLLHRQYGSAIRTLVRSKGKHSEEVETDPFCEEAVEHFLERDAVVDTCREIFDILGTRYPRASALLEEMSLAEASARARIVVAHGGFRGEPAQVLRNFGILAGAPESPALPEVICWYARNVHPSSNRSAAQ